VYQLIENAQNNVTPLHFPAPVWDGRFRIVPKRRSERCRMPGCCASRQGTNIQRAKGNDETVHRQRATCSMQPRARGGNDPAARGVESTAVGACEPLWCRPLAQQRSSEREFPTAETSTRCRKVPRPEPFPARRAAGHQQARHPDALELRPQGAALCRATHAQHRTLAWLAPGLPVSPLHLNAVRVPSSRARPRRQSGPRHAAGMGSPFPHLRLDWAHPAG
jgi:hypothetical protein